MQRARTGPGMVRWLGLSLMTAASLAVQAQTREFESITAERLRSPEPGDWINYRRTYDVTAFSPLDEINRRTVDDLRLVWAYGVEDRSRWSPTPIVAGGLMYIAEGSGRVIALDAGTGELVWTHLRTYPDDIRASEAYPRHRGLSILDNVIYWGTADSHVVALDAGTGRVIWDVETGDYHEGAGHAHPPLIADGKVFIGTTGGDFAARGRFHALDAKTGEILWTFYTVPRKGQPGFETWTEDPDSPPLGGAPWNTASYDPELGIVYFSTGQPTPWSTAARGPGDSLFSNTVLAVDAETGELRWHFQLVPADEWDRSAYESMLVDLEIDGVMRKALIQTGKIGWGVVLDRETGEFLHAFRTAYDNVVTGWTHDGRPIYNPDTIPAPEDLDSGKVFQICPHIHGARNLQAPSYSPVTELYYLPVNNSCMNAQVVTPRYLPGRGLTGVNYTATLAPGYDFVGEFVAFDPVTGKRAWEYRPPSGAPMVGSALATAGGIVFGGTADRQLFALNDETGELLWNTRLQGDVSGAPITYELGGKQYLAVGAGGRAGPTTSLGRLVDVDVPQGSGVIWVFALPDREPLTIPRPVRPEAPTRSLQSGVFTAEQAAEGERVFNEQCLSCHEPVNYTGDNFRGRWAGQTLADVYLDYSLAMPPVNPGGLAPDVYASILAYFLRETGYPAGSDELPGDPGRLGGMAIGTQGD